MKFCIAGFYCAEEGLTEVTGPCAPGYFCVAGSDNDSPEICPQGRYCPEGESSYFILAVFL